MWESLEERLPGFAKLVGKEGNLSIKIYFKTVMFKSNK